MLILQGNMVYRPYTAIDELACWSLCKSTVHCNWFSFDTQNDKRNCQLFDRCPRIDKTDRKFVSGEKKCYIEKTGK